MARMPNSLMKTFALKGNLLYTPGPSCFESFPGHYLVCEDGHVAGIFDAKNKSVNRILVFMILKV